MSEVENKKEIIIYAIIYILLISISRILAFIVLSYFSPILFIVTELPSSIIRINLGNLKIKQIIQSITLIALVDVGCSILMFSSLIYNEIIILNFCGLNKNTKIFVEYRFTEEIIELSKVKTQIMLDDINNDDDENHIHLSIDSNYYISNENI